MSRITEWCAAAIAIIGPLVAASALAHAPPEISRVVWSADGNQMALVTNRGLIFKNAQSGTWSMMCGAALGTGPVSETEGWDEPEVAYLPDGRLLAATSRGLLATADSGCTWRTVAPFEGQATSALAQHPSEPNTLYVSASGREGSSIQKSRDGGATWARELLLANGEAVTRLLFAPMHPARVYATLALAGPTGGIHALLRSADAGASWKRSAIPLLAGERFARLVAVSPRDPERLLVLVSAAARESQVDRVLVSRDGGETFSDLFASLGLRDAGFGADGASAWIAGDEALWQSDASLSEPTPVGTAQLVTCVGVHAGSLYACGHHSGFDPPGAGLGVSTNGGQTFQRYMAFTDVMKRVSCEPSSDAARMCQADWSDWQLEILVALGGAPIDSVLGDAGTAVASGTDPTAKPRQRAGAGCTIARSGGAGGGGCLSFVAWAIAFCATTRGPPRRRAR